MTEISNYLYSLQYSQSIEYIYTSFNVEYSKNAIVNIEYNILYVSQSCIVVGQNTQLRKNYASFYVSQKSQKLYEKYVF